MARGNQRDKAREKNLKKQAGEVIIAASPLPPLHPNTRPIARATTQPGRPPKQAPLSQALPPGRPRTRLNLLTAGPGGQSLDEGSLLITLSFSLFHAGLPIVTFLEQRPATSGWLTQAAFVRNPRTARVAPRCSTTKTESPPSCARSRRRVRTRRNSAASCPPQTPQSTTHQPLALVPRYTDFLSSFPAEEKKNALGKA